jgi:CRISPR-associated protein Csd2
MNPNPKATTMSDINRATGLLVLEVVNSNPNGDPDRESDPRQRPNGQGEISPVSFKRKLRDLVDAKDQPVFQSLEERLHLEKGRYEILESRGRNREAITREMKDGANGDFMQSTFVKKYWDARVFGNTFLEEDGDKGTIKTGVVQFGMGLSVKPVEVVRHTNTNKAGVEEGKDQGMAPMAYRVVTHAVYCMPFFVNPTYAPKSGCTAQDIELLKALIPYAYDHTRSAIRPDVRIRHAWFVEHKDALGTCPDFKIFDALMPKTDKDRPTCWEDYTVPTALPADLTAKGLVLVDLAN